MSVLGGLSFAPSVEITASETTRRTGFVEPRESVPQFPFVEEQQRGGTGLDGRVLKELDPLPHHACYGSPVPLDSSHEHRGAPFVPRH